MSSPEIMDGEIVEHGTDLELAAPAQSPTLFGTDDPVEFIANATRTATALANVVRTQGLITKIGQSDHVKVEGWTLLGSMLGVYAVTAWTRPIQRADPPFERWGWEARVEARSRAGVLVGAAEAQCTRDEKQWSYTPTNRYGKALEARDDYALRSMAQTRATSKALRQPLGFVMQLAGFNPTPAEEMPADRGTGSGSEPRGEPLPAAAAGTGSAEFVAGTAEVQASDPDTTPPDPTEPADLAILAHCDRLETELLDLSGQLEVDQQLVRTLVASRRVEHEDDPEALRGWLEKQIKRAHEQLAAQEQPAFEPPAGERGSPQLATKAQRTKIILTCKEAGLDDAGRHELLQRVTGQPSTNGVLRRDVQRVLDAIAQVQT